MRPVPVRYSFLAMLLLGWVVSGGEDHGYAAEGDHSRTIVGTVQNQDLRRIDQATVQVRDPRLASLNPQFRSLGLFEEFDHPIVGVHPASPLPLRFASVDRLVRFAAPMLGQHNVEILRDVAGLDAGEIERLADAGVIGDVPADV